jgi:hypothetical protein
MERGRGRAPSKLRLYAGFAIVIVCMLGGFLVGLVVVAEGRRDLSAPLWGAIGFIIGLIGGAMLARALLFRR